ncbi:TPA: DNA polymerase III subunit gamma/tau [Candidatus Gastranaerophilales bacterium HUM_13]|nr:MAG TPA: DNA polymerase III subunit gamma/tau [Candidatus Gastranaerophilales bacterium HUM_13]
MYQALYRKWRPMSFDDVVSQPHITTTLKNQIKSGKTAHAYLFTGSRGTGKTTCAKLMAKAVNCLSPVDGNPCGECESCRDITNSVPIDVIEIDAASNRKVEDTQSILEKIQYVPVNGRYKIYIIDEVHMLTNHAFNALLKTLEEPPENVIFILATTEVHKVLDTIKSRCQRFDFRRITTEDIVKHLRYISDEEKINISDDALFTIAKNSAGGMRDSISLLDQLSLLGVSKQVTSEDVNAILGRISFDILNKLSSKIIDAKPNEAIEILNDIYNSGNEPLQILTNLSEYFKNLLIVKNCRKELLCELTGLNEPQIEELSKQKELLETHQIVFLLERITYYIKEVKMASNQHLWLEVGMIDLANMTENTTLLDLQNRVKALEGTGVAPAPRTVVQAAPPQAPASRPVEPVTRPAPVPPQETPVVKPEPQPEPSEDFTPPPVSRKPDGNDIQSLWQTLLMNIKSPATKALLNLASPVKISPDEVIITFKNDKLVSQINDTNKKQMLVEAANTMFNQSDSKVIVRLPQANDAVVEKKKLTVEEPAPQPQPVPQAAEPQPVAVEEKNVPSKNIEREESDQEKMVLELFDGKYIE